MMRHALVLGAGGRFGRAMAEALEHAGWHLHRFTRGRDGLPDAARGMDLIVNGWNPPYDQWASQLPGLTAEVIAAAQASGARVVFPGNVYVYGSNAPPVLHRETPHAATNPLGRLRVEAEEMYRASGIRLLILRAGDFIDTEMSGNWFDRVLTKPLGKGQLVYPGARDAPHAWAFLPDLGRAGAALLDRDLPDQLEVLFPGYTLSAQDLAGHLSEATGRAITLTSMSWTPIRLGALFNPMLRGVLEMRYLWSLPHEIDGASLQEVLPDFVPTDPVTALARTAPVRALEAAG